MNLENSWSITALEKKIEIQWSNYMNNKINNIREDRGYQPHEYYTTMDMRYLSIAFNLLKNKQEEWANRLANDYLMAFRLAIKELDRKSKNYYER